MIPIHDDNPTDITPAVTLALIGLCIFGFMWQLTLGQEGNRYVVLVFGVIPAVLLGNAELHPSLAVVPAPVTVVTSMFLHGGFMHLAGNMLYLWVFGNNVEDAMGHLRFILFYIACGIAAALTQALFNPASGIPMIGASGAISGVLGAYLLLYPNARVLIGIPIFIYLHMVRLSAFWVLVLWFGVQTLSSLLADPSKGGVAWYAHIGGFLAGLALIPFFKHRHVRLLSPRNTRLDGMRRRD